VYAFLSYHSKTILLFRVTVTWTFDIETWKSIEVICQSWSIYLWSFMILGVCVLELSYDNHLVDGPTDLPTDRPTWAKQYTPSSSKGGIITRTMEMETKWKHDILRLNMEGELILAHACLSFQQCNFYVTRYSTSIPDTLQIQLKMARQRPSGIPTQHVLP
jgi:hypothetical protein